MSAHFIPSCITDARTEIQFRKSSVILTKVTSHSSVINSIFSNTEVKKETAVRSFLKLSCNILWLLKPYCSHCCILPYGREKWTCNKRKKMCFALKLAKGPLQIHSQEWDIHWITCLSLKNKCGFHVNGAVTKTMMAITHLLVFVTKLNKTDLASLERAAITDGLIP